MSAPPTGAVTFLFTDIEGSTASWERHRDLMQAAFAKIEIFNRLSYCATSEVIQ
jgi:class 3 adenylate cyclase